MSDAQAITRQEFRALRRLHSHTTGLLPPDVVSSLVAKRLILANERGLSLTIEGRAAHLAELVKAFDDGDHGAG